MPGACSPLSVTLTGGCGFWGHLAGNRRGLQTPRPGLPKVVGPCAVSARPRRAAQPAAPSPSCPGIAPLLQGVVRAVGLICKAAPCSRPEQPPHPAPRCQGVTQPLPHPSPLTGGVAASPRPRRGQHPDTPSRRAGPCAVSMGGCGQGCVGAGRRAPQGITEGGVRAGLLPRPTPDSLSCGHHVPQALDVPMPSAMAAFAKNKNTVKWNE